MFRRGIACFLGAALCMSAFACPGKAAQVDCDTVYCFSPDDFGEELAGICITSLPQPQAGTVLLGSRVLRPGDILTADQVARMTFAPVRSEQDRDAQVGYLPIFEGRVAEDTVMTISIRGKEDKAPVAQDSAMETYKNLANTGKLKAEDPEGESLTFTVTRQPRRGTVSIGEDGTFTYTPKKNKVGVDSFVYTAADPAGNLSREATVTVTILKPTDAAQYTDTAGLDCRFAAEWMKHTGIFSGENLAGNPCFGPEKTVSRGEFLSMLVKTLEIPTQEDAAFTGYTDEAPQWLKPYLAAAMRSGLTAGLPDQEVFGAETAVTGAEVAVMLQNALDLTVAEQAVAADTEGPEWAALAVAALQEAGIQLDAQNCLTRSEAALALYQAKCLADAEENRFEVMA